MTDTHDAIIVGARCAGSPLAMLLARAGHRVLVVDRATFPSDTISTHILHPPAVAALARWGLLDRLVGDRLPAGDPVLLRFRPGHDLRVHRARWTGPPTAYCPRRIVLDALLVEAAAEAGAELREGFTVEEVLVEDGRVTGIRGRDAGGHAVTERARVVVGADGRHSRVAKAVRPEHYEELPPLTPAYYAYWSGLPVDGFETYVRAEDGRGWAAMPTHDGLTCVIVGWPQAQFHDNRKDVEGTYMHTFDLAPEFAQRMRAATRETRLVGSGDLPGWFRTPFGPGWALVGDAGYHKHPITAFGITDAFRDAEQVSAALDDTFTGRRAYDAAMAEHQRLRDAHAMPIYGFTAEFATLEPPPAEMQALFGAMQGDHEAQDDFVSVMAGTLGAPEFFAPENLQRIMAGVGSP